MRVTRIEVAAKISDTRASVMQKKLKELGFDGISRIFLHDVYSIEKIFSPGKFEKIASALANPVTQQSFIVSGGKDFPKSHFDWAIEIGFLPGVTDNIANTAKEIISDLLTVKFKDRENVYSSQIVFIKGDIDGKKARSIADSLYNPLIARVHIKNIRQYLKEKGMDFTVPKVTLTKRPFVLEADLNIPDEQLAEVGKLGIAERDGIRRGPLALDLAYMKSIQKYFRKLGRNPTDIELESIAQTWSEHCKHTIFTNPIDEIKDGLFSHYIKRATDKIRKKKGKHDFCVSVFSDNSGGIVFDDNFLITHKVETHNSPSALDPFGGSITGIVGVNRDTIGFGLGAKPIANLYGFCLADPKKDITYYKGANKTQKMLSSRRIMDGVIYGINSGGNQSGIPTPQGFIYFDERYRGKPLVFAGTVGLIPRKINGRFAHIKKANPGDYIVMIGGRVGKDGIHGATFSSEALNEKSPAAAVQIGDPITQKKLSDVLINEARGMLLYNSITDNGAGGLSCSVAEMAKEFNGCKVYLDKVPLKYVGLSPWEIWISESQERMTLAVPKNKWKKFNSLIQRRDVEATIIGEFTRTGKCQAYFDDKKIMDVDLAFLHYGLPQKLQITTRKEIKHKEPVIENLKNLNKSLLDMLSRLNIASFEFISQQYDHVVLGNSMLGPLQGRGRVNGDVSVIRPVISSKRGAVLSCGLYPRYSDIDTYRMAAAAIDTAVRNAIAAGADPSYIALLDNFCWSLGKNPESLAKLKSAAKACYDCAIVYETPFISGKDSMYNDFSGYDRKGNPITISIPQTLLITSVGIANDVTEIVSLDAKIAGDLVYILGETYDELGASEYYAMRGEAKNESYTGNNVPRVDSLRNKRLYDAYFTCIKKRVVASAQSVGKGGLAVALAKTAMGGMLGLDIDLSNLPGRISREDYALYSESQGRIVVTIAPGHKKTFEKLMFGNSFALIGKVTKKQDFIISGLKRKIIIHTDVGQLLNSYRKTFRDF